MTQTKTTPKILPLIGDSTATLLKNAAIFKPFVTIIFLQLLALEILYFITRFPLVNFFGPVISKLGDPLFLHFPYNFFLLAKTFPNIQIFLFIFINGLLICSAMISIAGGEAAARPLSNAAKKYIPIFLGTIIIFITFLGLNYLYNLILLRALKIRSMSGALFLIKTIITQGTPYFNLLIAALVTTFFGFLFPLIVIAKKNIFQAVLKNFQMVFSKNFFAVFMLVFIPSLFYLPIILLRLNLESFEHIAFDTIRLSSFIFSIIVMGLIDAVVYTSLTQFYLKGQNT